MSVRGERFGGFTRWRRFARRRLGRTLGLDGTFTISTWLFLRLLGVVYLVAFASLAGQVRGLVGARGILPAAGFLDAVRDRLGAAAYLRLPTLCWIDAGDAMLVGLCAGGAALSLVLVAGAAARPVLALLWILYLSLSVAGQAFLSFQWDALLLETGLLALFVAPGRWRPHLAGAGVSPGRAGRWLLWLLMVKLMFLSGVTKLLSGDPTWRDLTALAFHHETQPLPTWIGWWAHQLPAPVQQVCVAATLAAEMALPLAIVGTRWMRHSAAAGLAALQVVIALDGNYGFFNLLTLVLCVPLLDDRLLRRVMPARLLAAPPVEAPVPPAAGGARRWRSRLVAAAAAAVALASVLSAAQEMVGTARRDRVWRPVMALLDAADLLLLSWGDAVLSVTDPFRSINGYGLFRVMTTRRHEIILEASRDGGRTWRPWEFRWKPGDPARRPRFVAPHMPRLDWQMWFAALDPSRHEYWLVPLMRRLLEESEVAALMGDAPDPRGPPDALRLTFARYAFTDRQTRQATGRWWLVEPLGPITPPIRRAAAPPAD